MSDRFRLCLVTDELFPFTAGGIGRLLHNLVVDSVQRKVPVEIHLLLTMPTSADDQQIREYFQKEVQVHRISAAPDGPAEWSQGILYPPASSQRACKSHARSFRILMKLKTLALQGVHFDAIEFADYAGLAFCTLQEKRLGLGFAEAEIVVRLHSTEGVLQGVEDWSLSNERLGLFELERKSLQDADRVVAHLAGIGRFNCEYYGFAPAWLEKVAVQFPPVVQEGAASRDPSPGPKAEDRPLVFASRVQQFKRPDLFVRGAVRFMTEVPEYRGTAVLACNVPDPAYGEKIAAMVPSNLKQRFVFLGEPGAERERLLRSGIVAVPSSYESLNLLAYEVAAAGGSLVLNGTCLAFGDDSPFVDGRNCHKFDGTPEGLAKAFARSWRLPPPEKVAWRADAPYWEVSPPRRAKRTHKGGANRKVSVVVTYRQEGVALLRALESVAESSYPHLEILVVDDASEAKLDLALLEQVERASGRWSCGVRTVRSPVRVGLGGARNLGVASADGDYVLILGADDVLAPGFIELAVKALDEEPDYGGVVPAIAYFPSEEDLYQGIFADYDWFLGDAPALGLVVNHLGRGGLLRRSLFEQFSYDEGLEHEEDWDFFLRLSHGGRRFLVTQSIQLYRPAPEEAALAPDLRRMLQARMYRSLPKPPKSSEFFAFLVQAETAKAPEWNHPFEPRPLRHHLVDGVNRGLQKLPLGARLPAVRYAWVDSVNLLLKKNQRLHSLIRGVLG